MNFTTDTKLQRILFDDFFFIKKILRSSIYCFWSEKKKFFFLLKIYFLDVSRPGDSKNAKKIFLNFPRSLAQWSGMFILHFLQNYLTYLFFYFAKLNRLLCRCSHRITFFPTTPPEGPTGSKNLLTDFF